MRMVYVTNINEDSELHVLSCTWYAGTAVRTSVRVTLLTLMSHVTPSAEHSNRSSAFLAVCNISIVCTIGVISF